MVKDSAVPLNDKKATISYSLSKATVSNEMGDFDNYNKMNLSEFLECIGRMATLLYTEDKPLTFKVEKLLYYLLNLVDCVYIPYDADDMVESESDQDDDWAEAKMVEIIMNSEAGEY